MTEDWRLVQLRRAVQNLAAEPDEQVRALTPDGFRASVDELGLDLGYAMERLEPPSTLTPDQRAALRDLQDLIHQMSGKENAELWTREALKTAVQWQKARHLAREALRLLPARDQEG